MLLISQNQKKTFFKINKMEGLFKMGTTETRFQLFVPLRKSNSEHQVTYELNPDGTLDIEGIASTTSKDLQGDVMLPSAIDSMKQQILTLGKNLHGDHRPFLFDGLMGAVNKVYETDNEKLKIGATILSKYASDIKEMLDIGVNLGFSVGGAMKEYTINKSNGLNISDVYLDEVSLTAIPANLDTLGTVTTQKGVVKSNCLGGICWGLQKNLQKNLNQKNNDEEINMSEEGNQQNQQNNKNDELDSKIKATVDELWNEKQQGLVTAIVNEIKPELKNIVQEEINKKEEEPEGGSQPSTPAEPVEKNNLNPEETAKIIAKTVKDEMNSFKEQFFKSANENRNPQPAVNLNQQEAILNKNQNAKNNKQDDTSMVKTYSTEETSKILLRKQRSINPIVSAALNNI